MKTSKLAKSIFTYLPLLVLMMAVVVSMYMAKDLYPTSLDAQTEIPAQFSAEQNDPQPPNLLKSFGEAGTCILGNIYTSLPPKCRTFDGSFIPANETSPSFILIPQAK